MNIECGEQCNKEWVNDDPTEWDAAGLDGNNYIDKMTCNSNPQLVLKNVDTTVIQDVNTNLKTDFNTSMKQILIKM